MAKTLTIPAIEKMKPDPNKRLEIPDAKMSGLYLVVQPSGAKSWAYRYRADGKPKKLTLGRLLILGDKDAEPREPILGGALTLTGARRLAMEAANKVLQGADPAGEKKRADARAKAGLDDRDDFAAVAIQFIERDQRPKNRSWQETARLLGIVADHDSEFLVVAKQGLARHWKDRKVQDITRRDIIELLDDVADKRGKIVANRTLAAVRRMMNWCVERDILAVSPAREVKAPAPEIARDRVLNDDEIRWLWTACDEIGFPFGPAVKLLLLTGQRRDEVGKMQAKELRRQDRLWIIPRGRTKGDREHDVHLSDPSIVVLDGVKRIAGPQGYIFTTNGESAVSGWSKAKDRLDKAMLRFAREEAIAAGRDPDEIEISDWRLHDLRRTAASLMARIGIAPHVIEKVLNHKEGSTIRGVAAVYNRYSYADEKRSALDALSRFVGGLIDGKDASNVIDLRAAE